MKLLRARESVQSSRLDFGGIHFSTGDIGPKSVYINSGPRSISLCEGQVEVLHFS